MAAKQSISLEEAWMNVHKNARLTPDRRVELVQRVEAGEPGVRIATALGISLRTVRKWWARYRAEGRAGLDDRSSRPQSSPRQTAAAMALAIKVLRRQRWTCAQIAGAVGVSAATAGRILRRAGLSRPRRLGAPPVIPRYQHAPPGDPLPPDTKKPRRLAGPARPVT